MPLKPLTHPITSALVCQSGQGESRRSGHAHLKRAEPEAMLMVGADTLAKRHVQGDRQALTEIASVQMRFKAVRTS
jgi:hypothetical protein